MEDATPLRIVEPPTPSGDIKQKAAEVFAFGEERMRALTSAIIDRMQFAQRHGLTFGTKRDLYAILGYNRDLTNQEYGERYARGGIAGRVVDVYPNATWRGQVDVVEDKDPHKDTTFESTWKKLDRKHQIQAKLLRADKLSLLSTYSVLLIGAPGNLNEELPRGNPDKLLFLTPYSGGGGPGRALRESQRSRSIAFDADVSVLELETDNQNPRFGLPKTYELRRSELIGGQGTPLPVHWTRVIHIAENVLWDEIYGLPALERVWNLLDDLEKVTGGGAEAFWLRANQGMHLDVSKDMDLEDSKEAVASLKEQADQYKHQLTRWLRTRGVSVTPLGSDVANFASPADAILTQIAGSKGIPKRILTGSEMGELASSQDRDNWKDQINGRQTQYAGPYILRPLIDRFIQYGYLPTPLGGPDVYEVKWPNVQVRTDDEKAAGAVQWANVNKAQGEVVFRNDEIRSYWYGFEELTDEEKQPIAAPIRENATPTLNPDDPGGIAKPVAKPVPPNLKAAEELPNTPEMRELLRILDAAIACGNTQVIDEILGISHSG